MQPYEQSERQCALATTKRHKSAVLCQGLYPQMMATTQSTQSQPNCLCQSSLQTALHPTLMLSFYSNKHGSLLHCEHFCCQHLLDAGSLLHMRVQHPPQNMADGSVLGVVSHLASELSQNGMGLWRHHPPCWRPGKRGCLHVTARGQGTAFSC